MAESLRDRLIPSLLDRLADDEPAKKNEARDRRVLSLAQLRQSVLRDIGWLLNTTRLSASQDLSAFPEVEKSVVNFGLPALSGQTYSSMDIQDLERVIRQALIDFEPRLLADSVDVHALVSEDLDHHNVVSFQIEALLWAQPAPIELLVRTDMDLESGQTKVVEAGR